MKRVPEINYKAESSEEPLTAPRFLLGGSTGLSPQSPDTASPAASRLLRASDPAKELASIGAVAGDEK